MIGSRDNIQYLIFYYLWWAISILHGSDALVMNTWRLNQLKFNFALQQDFFCSILLSFDELCNLIPPSTISSSSFSCLLATTPPPPSHFLPLLFFSFMKWRKINNSTQKLRYRNEMRFSTNVCGSKDFVYLKFS